MSDQFFWFATRSAGILAWFSAASSLVVGLLLSTRALGRRPTIPWLLDLHRFFGAMSVVFLAIHLFTLWADSFVSFGPAELFVPGVAHVPGLSRFSLALGVVAGWFLVIIEASSLIRTYLPARFWHTLHLTSFGVVAAGAIHAIQAGSDTDNRYVIALAASITTAVCLLAVIRMFSKLFERKRIYDDSLAGEWDEYDDYDDYQDYVDYDDYGYDEYDNDDGYDDDPYHREPEVVGSLGDEGSERTTPSVFSSPRLIPPPIRSADLLPTAGFDGDDDDPDDHRLRPG